MRVLVKMLAVSKIQVHFVTMLVARCFLQCCNFLLLLQLVSQVILFLCVPISALSPLILALNEIWLIVSVQKV